MRKVFQTLFLVGLGCYGSISASAAGAPFTIDCSLEADGDLDGWKIQGSAFSRNTGSYFGLGAQSPDYIVAATSATSNDVIFTPIKNLAAGEPCTIEFYYHTPGGVSASDMFVYSNTTVSACSSQSLDDKVVELGKPITGSTSGWTKCSYTFTPEQDGEYCFAIQAGPAYDAYASYCGPIGFDSFFIEGSEIGGGGEVTPPVVEPSGDGKPFTIDCGLEFDSDLDDWKIQGSAFSRNTGDWFGLGAQTPDYIIGATSATSNDVIFTPVRNLVAGQPCTFEFYYHTPGGVSASDMFVYSNTSVSVCSSQSLDDKVVELGKPITGTTSGWTKCAYTFTPEQDGEYCFAVQAGPAYDAYASYCGPIGFDSFFIEGFEIDGGGEVTPPVVEPEPSGETQPFAIDCSLEFNDDLDGWKIDGSGFTRNTGDWFGYGANTPDYVIGGNGLTSSDIIFTPVKNLAAGKPCTIEFYYHAPGPANNGNIFNYKDTKVYVCSSQSIADNVEILASSITAPTSDWTKFTATFTPEKDGEYCFAIQAVPYLDSYASMCGWLGFDSFYIEGTEVVATTPQPGKDPQGTPFEKVFTFDDDADFPGINVLPAGWYSNGTKPMRRYSAAELGLPTPPSGEMVVGNNGPATKQDNILSTEYFSLEGGVPAEFSFWFSAQSATTGLGYGFNIYASTTHELDGAVLIGSVAQDPDRSNAWMQSDTFTFTPEADGKYSFIIAPVNEMGYLLGGSVAFDNISVSGYEVELDPEEKPEPIEGTPEAFTIECSFEFEDDLDGWKIEGSGLSRNTGDWFGLGANTPDYILGGSSITSDHIIFSPVKTLAAGEPCTIEFYFNTPSGSNSLFNYGASTINVCTSQSLSSKVAELGKLSPSGATNGWQKCNYTFTPEESGDYCFAIQVNPYSDQFAIQCGIVGFDSFIIEGTTLVEDEGGSDTPVIDLEPNPDHLADCIDLPYLEDFNGGNYDGTSYLPIGWTSTGSVTWVTSSHKSVPAVEGDYYMVAPHNTEGERDDRSYTPFFNLEAGKTYTIEYHVYMQGNRWNEEDILYLPTLDFTVGTEQEADFHTTIASFSKECIEWVPQTHTFTPEKSGPYCFAFMLSGPTNSGYVFVDAFKVTAEGLVPRVEPGFMVKGVYTIMDSDLTLGFTDEPIKIANTSKYADSYKWTVEGAVNETSTSENPEFYFPASGNYTVVLEATNSRGSRRTQRTINVKLLNENDAADTHPMTLFNANQDRLYGTGETPAFDTDPEGDFVTGYNHYYFDLAQRFDFSREAEIDLRQLTVNVTNRRFRGMTSFYDDQRIRPFSIVVYGAKEDGSLDEEKIFGRLDGTIGEILGSSGLYSFEGKDIQFETPITVKGTFYIAMHFDRGMEVIPQSADLGRSYIATQVIRHGHGQTTLYAKPFDKPAASYAVLDEWNSVDALDARLKGMGAYWILWANMHGNNVGATAIGADGNIMFAACFMGQNLNVSGTSEGETVEVYDLNGVKVATASAEEGATVIPASHLNSGIYIVKCGDNATKVLK